MAMPTAQTWDLVKKAVSGQVERHTITGAPLPDSASPGNYGVRTAAQDLTKELRSAIPGYGDALDKGGDYLSLQKAFSDGQAHIGQTATTSRAVTKYVAGLSPAEKQAYAGGVANKLYELADNGRLKPSTYQTPAFQTKLAAAVGSEAAAKIIAGARQEGAISSSLTRMLPQTNSPTAMYKQEMEAQDSTPAWIKHGAEFVVNSAVAGPHVAGVKLGMGMAGKIPQLLAKPFQMSDEARNAAGQLLMSPTVTPEEMAAYAAAHKASKINVRFRPPIPQLSGGGQQPRSGR